jgi:hypothetical protein
MSFGNICPDFFFLSSEITLKLQAPEVETEGGGEEVGSIVIHLQDDKVCAHFLYVYLNCMMDISAVIQCGSCSGMCE